MTLKTFLRRILSIGTLLCFWANVVFPLQAQALSFVPIDSAVLLPKPGSMVNLSPVFEPALIKGLKIHPDNPFLFDFIVDPGNEQLSSQQLKSTAQRMINYFMASMAVPEKDLWVNLSPVEKNHIVPDTLIKTELGRDLLAEDYLLKQLSASLIYPETHLGKVFWDKVYEDAYRKFGTTKLPVNLFNKVWILPQKASVYEKGDAVYIVNAHLKVMLEEDYLAQQLLGKKKQPLSPVKDITKQVLRQVVLPLIEKEVNEDKNFAPLRQVFYSLILAQWYQEAFKNSILNKDYAGRSKMAGIDVSDPRYKNRIYQQYLSAYKKGVFNYIKEEMNRVSQQPVPRKYFSGGFVDQAVSFAMATEQEMDKAQIREDTDVLVDLIPEEKAVSTDPWELKSMLENILLGNGASDQLLVELIDQYSSYLAGQRRYPVQSPQPLFKAISLLTKQEEDELMSKLEKKYGNDVPELVDKIFLFHHLIYGGPAAYIKRRLPHLEGRVVYLTADEIHYWTGGLGPVMEFVGKGMAELGIRVRYIELGYQKDKQDNPLDYVNDPNIQFQSLHKDDIKYTVEIGEMYPDRRGIVSRRAFSDRQWALMKNSGYIDDTGGLLPKSDELRGKNYLGINLPLPDREKQRMLNIIAHVRGWSIAESNFGNYKAILVRCVEEGILGYAPSGEIRLKVDLDQWNIDKIRAIAGQRADGFLSILGRFKPVRQIDVSVDSGVDKNGVPVDLIRDVQVDGNSLYTEMLYKYTRVGMTDVMAFSSTARAELIKIRETARKKKEKDAWRPAIVHANDGQLGTLQAVTLSRYGSDEAVKDIVWAFTTHTYVNQGWTGPAAVPGVINTFLKQMLRMDDRYINGFRNRDEMNYSSGAINLAVATGGVVAGVADRHVDDVSGWTPNARMRYIALTNGSVPEKMARIFREEFLELFPEGDYTRLTVEQDYQTKIATKERLNQAGLKSSTGRVVHVDPHGLVLGCVRRLVPEKMDISDDEILFLVEHGAEIVWGGQDQGGGPLFERFKGLEERIFALKNENPQAYPGAFYFVAKFSPEEKVLLESDFDGQIQRSWDNEANGATEEPVLPNGGYNIVNPGGIGFMTAQGMLKLSQWDPKEQKYVYRPGGGNILAPHENTLDSWINTVWRPFIDLWNEDPLHHRSFYEGAILGPRFDRAAYYWLTAAANLGEYERVIVRQQRNAVLDAQAQQRIVQALGEDRQTMDGILNKGRNGVSEPFKFTIYDKGVFQADGLGLRAFLNEKDSLENEYGFDALIQHFNNADFQLYLRELFHGTGEAASLLDQWLDDLEADTETTNMEKTLRLGNFLHGLQVGLQRKVEENRVDAASISVLPGGIKFAGMKVEHQGSLTTDVISDQALEETLLHANGLAGIIVGIRPIPSLLDFVNTP